MIKVKWAQLSLATLAVTMFAATTACSSSTAGSSPSTSSSVSSTSSSSTTRSVSSNTGGGTVGSVTGGSTAANDTVAAAKAVIAPYVGHPGPFPVSEKLAKVPTGATVAFMDCGLPYCALYWSLLQTPAKMLGINLDRINAGETAVGINTAFDSVVAKKPAGVIVMANQMQLWAKQLKQLQQLHIPVVTQGVTDAEKYGIVSPQGGVNQDAAVARLEANYIPAEMNAQANVVYYEVPELSFTLATGADFTADLKTACPKCSVRIAQIPASTIGKTSNNNIVSDLQAHTDTNLAVFSDPDLSVGLPTALKTAGIKVQTLNTGPGPTSLQQIKDGGETVGLGSDTSVASWTLLDEVARQIVGQPVTGSQAQGVQVFQFLTQKDITFDPSKGWSGYPDFAKRFATLWGVPVPS